MVSQTPGNSQPKTQHVGCQSAQSSLFGNHAFSPVRAPAAWTQAPTSSALSNRTSIPPRPLLLSPAPLGNKRVPCIAASYFVRLLGACGVLGWSSFENSSSLGLPEYESVCRHGGKGKWYTLAGHVLFTSAQYPFLSYYYTISHFFNASERIYTEYGKDLFCCKAHICQGAMWQGMAGSPRGLPGRTAPARAGPTIPARSRAGWGARGQLGPARLPTLHVDPRPGTDH